MNTTELITTYLLGDNCNSMLTSNQMEHIVADDCVNSNCRKFSVFLMVLLLLEKVLVVSGFESYLN